MAFKPYTLLSVTANTETDLVVPGSTVTSFVQSLNICNFDTSSQALVTVKLTDGSNTNKGYIFYNLAIDPGKTLLIDNFRQVVPGNATAASAFKIRVISSIANVSFTASGDEA